MKSLQSTVYRLQLWLLVSLAFLSMPAQAAPPDNSAVTRLPNPLAVEDIPSLAGKIIKAVLGIVGAVALLMFIWGGFLWLTAAGNPDKIKQGKNTLVWATIGLVFIFSSYIIANFIINALTGGS